MDDVRGPTRADCALSWSFEGILLPFDDFCDALRGVYSRPGLFRSPKHRESQPSWRSSQKPLHSNHDLTARLSHSLLRCASAGDPGVRTRGIGEPSLSRRVLPPGIGTPHHSHSFTVPGFPPARVVSP